MQTRNDACIAAGGPVRQSRTEEKNGLLDWPIEARNTAEQL